MPQYMLLIYNSGPAPTQEEMAASMPRWNQYTQDLQDAGVMRAGDALHGPETATTVRERDGELQITDGPFAETKETLGGYYVVEVPDLDSALKWAGKMPNISYGSVEVRPVVDFSGLPAAGETATASA